MSIGNTTALRRVAHPLSLFDKGWGIAKRPLFAWDSDEAG